MGNMRLLIFALVLAISYAQTEWSLASPATEMCFERIFDSDCPAFSSVASATNMAEDKCDYTTYNKYCEGGDEVVESTIGCGSMRTRFYHTEASCVLCSGSCTNADTSVDASTETSGTNSGSGGSSGEGDSGEEDGDGDDNPPAKIGTTAYSIEGPQGCVEGKGGGNPTSTQKTCVNGELTVSEWRENGSTDCTGTPDETVAITDLGTCKLNDDLGPDVKTTIECMDNKIKATTCGDDVGIICSTNDDGDVRGCTKQMCAELCCRRNSNFEAYTHSYWSEWSMK